jgi:hypothetical protein
MHIPSTGVALPSTFGHPVTEKLTKSNYALWKLQVLPAIRGARLVGYTDGSSPAPPEEITTGTGAGAKTEPNPAYTAWLALDQQVFSYVVTSLTKDVLK